MGTNLLGRPRHDGAYGPDGPVYRPGPSLGPVTDFTSDHRTDFPICGKTVRLAKRKADELKISSKLRWMVNWLDLHRHLYRLTCLDQERPPLDLTIWDFELE